MGSPVFGLRPSYGLSLRMVKQPNPRNSMRSLRASASTIESNTQSNTRSSVPAGTLVRAASIAIRSDLTAIAVQLVPGRKKDAGELQGGNSPAITVWGCGVLDKPTP